MSVAMGREQTRKLIGVLPPTFVAVAFFNFVVGASLGGWMATDISLWSLVGPIHGETNPFGWLTMLIYGMTYAVLVAFAGLRPPKAWLGWLHLFAAEAGVVLITSSYLDGSLALYRIGLILQCLAPTLFLINILWAVVSARRQRSANLKRGFGDEIVSSEEAEVLPFLSPSLIHKATDRIAQRGTDASLMLFIVAACWMLVEGLIQKVPPLEASPSNGALFLVYYGWIGGTVLAVSLHLFPRFLGTDGLNAKLASVGQGLWGAGVVLGTLGTVTTPLIASLGNRLLGIAFLWSAVTYLTALIRQQWQSSRGDSGAQRRTLPGASLLAWWAGWLFCLVLGASLAMGLDPFSLLSFHLFFLAFATDLVYGIGYAQFPAFLSPVTPRGAWAIAQVTGALVGVLLMLIAFYEQSVAGVSGPAWVLPVGGVIAALSAIAFLLSWIPFSGRQTGRSSS